MSQKNKFVLLLLIAFGGINYCSAQNLLNMDGWTIGQGSSGIFGQNGQTIENIREWGDGPDGKRGIVWKAQPEGGAHDDGGWNTDPIGIDHTKMYRFSVWMKKTNSSTGTSYFGCQNVQDLNGNPDGNPYFFAGQLPELEKWYLLVGYIHGSGDVSKISLGGIYNAATGVKVAALSDFKFATNSWTTYHRAYLFYDANINDRQYFYAPRIDVINGNEPSIESMLPSSANGSAMAYFPGKVGIQTKNTENYELAVNGKVRAKEVRVETGWSDFVFQKGYPLLPLKEVEAFIEKNKHLPSVPSENEVAKNGIELGSINSKLLQKVEELTLYVIQMNKELMQIKAENKRLKTKN